MEYDDKVIRNIIRRSYGLFRKKEEGSIQTDRELVDELVKVIEDEVKEDAA